MTTDKKHLRSQLPIKEKCPYRKIAPQTSPSIQLEWQLTETVTECKTIIHRYKLAARAIVNLLLTASYLAHS
ncbi:hypothetical protein I7I48_09970 [Histoplasma ohiense]|nr:hypothetical protein I7I48_09970 [Histoplasma ohiense (nom. inval.)]